MGGTKEGRGWEIQESWPEVLLTVLPCRTGARGGGVGAGSCPGPVWGQRTEVERVLDPSSRHQGP